MSLQQSNVCLVSALCIGCLISFIRAAPILPTTSDPVQLTPPSSTLYQTIAATSPHRLHLIPQTRADDDWIPTGSTFYSHSATKVPVRTAFAAYIISNLTQIVHSKTLRVWPTHAERVKLDPFLSSIIQNYGAEATTVFRAIHPSFRFRHPKRRKGNLTRNASSFLATRTPGLMPATKVLRPTDSISPSAARSDSNIEKENKHKRKSKKRAKVRVTTPRPSIGVTDPAETGEIGVRSENRNPGLVLLGVRATRKARHRSTPSGSKSDTDIEEKDEDEEERQKSTMRGSKNSRRKQAVNGHTKNRNISIPMELTLPLKYLARAGYGESTEEPFIQTEPPVWKDTRYHFQHQSRQARLRLDSNPMVEYYPDNEKMREVCRDQSTIIGTDIVTGYIKPHIYQKHYEERVLYNEFRENWYDIAPILLMCHHPINSPVVKYLRCVITRHKMMESMLPKYPYHQVQEALP